MDADARGLVDNLFRRESARMLAALVRIFGPRNLSLAEDVVQDTLVRALETWKFGRLPENPSAWLMSAARNRALDVIRRSKTRSRFAPDLTRLLESGWSMASTVDAAFAEEEIERELLRMMFSCCAESVPFEAQIAMILKTLCGFGTGEIAHAFLAKEEAIEKRITRAKAALKRAPGLVELTPAKVAKRLPTVHRALYLLFSEGYHSSHPSAAVREELCGEALRLALLLAAEPRTRTPATHALIALMCLHAARLPARVDAHGELVLLGDQDRALWDRRLLSLGFEHLSRSGEGDVVSAYHVEAGIASKHALAADVASTDWAAIISLYDVLLALEPTPVVALNRAIAVAQRDGADAGIAALGAIERPDGYPFYDAALGELHLRAGRRDLARASFERAVASARTPAEAALLTRKLEASR